MEKEVLLPSTLQVLPYESYHDEKCSGYFKVFSSYLFSSGRPRSGAKWAFSPAPHIWVKNEETTEGRKASRASKTTPILPPSPPPF